MTTICPDNSTSCLLRAILDAQSGFNWDPLNFAFTAAIGVLALAVAMTTVFQGLISAGPGRVKASEAAIGPFAKFTESRFDRKEMRLRTTAKVPFINGVSVLKGVDSVEDFSSFANILRIFETKDTRKIKTFSARWLTLLGTAGYEVSEPTVNADKLISVDTDNLPPEVNAAPAWVTVKMAVVLALLSGCENVHMPEGSDYPIVRGRNAQLRFREHPDLGTVAVFDLLGQQKMDRNGKAWHDRVLWENFYGPIFYRNKGYRPPFNKLLELHIDAIKQDLHTRSEFSRCGHAYCRAIHDEREPELQSLVPLVAQAPIFLRGIADPESYISTVHTLAQQSSLWNTDKKIPNYARVIRSFSILGKYRVTPTTYSHPALGWSWLESDEYQAPDAQDMFLYQYSIHVSPNRRERALNLEEDIVFFRKAMEICSSTLPGVDFKRPPTGLSIRHSLGMQLHEVDYWLFKHGGALAACETRSLLYDVAQARLKDEQLKDRVAANQAIDPIRPSSPATTNAGTHENFQTAEPIDLEAQKLVALEEAADHTADAAVLPSSIPVEVGTSEDIQPAESRDIEAKRKDAMRSLLVFRAALWATYVATAADITCVSGELGERIIQML